MSAGPAIATLKAIRNAVTPSASPPHSTSLPQKTHNAPSAPQADAK